jgi:hypothetical protein
MKTLLVIAIAASLAACADAPVQQRYAQPADPGQWRVVSVTPVEPGTAARVAAASKDGRPVEYSSAPISQAPIYTPAPVYTPVPVYTPAPVYYPEPAYYWPPVSLSLGFVFGHRWGYGRGHYRGGGWRH